MDWNSFHTLREFGIVVIARLAAAFQLALDEKQLLVRGHLLDFIGADAADESRKLLSHAAVSYAEGLDDSGVVNEGVGLRPIETELGRILPYRPEPYSPGAHQGRGGQQRVDLSEIADFIAQNQCPFVRMRLSLRQRENQPGEP